MIRNTIKVKRKMKRVGYIYEKICDKENIKTAIWRASEHKRDKRAIKKVLDRIDEYVERVHEILITQSFKNTPTALTPKFEKLSQKTRMIRKPKFFPDQIVHWCIMLQVAPLIMRGMDPYCCANVPKRGEGRIRQHLQKVISEDKSHCRYVLKYDIHHFYESINVELLIKKVRRIIKDEKVITLINEVSHIEEHGLSIGTYTSQWLANYFLQQHDHFIREQLKPSYFYRYADDVVILGPNKRKLYKTKEAIERFLNQEDLSIKHNWVIFPLDDNHDIDFVGYRFLSNGKVIIRKRIWRNVRRCIAHIYFKGITLVRARRFMSYLGYIKNSFSHFIQATYLKLVKLKKLRKAVKIGGLPLWKNYTATV